MAVKKHGMAYSAEYRSWQHMKQRCKNPKIDCYHNYGGRGISFSKEWEIFENFFRDMGERPKQHSIERINNDLGYFKENCRWASRLEQNNNLRRKIDWAQALTIVTLGHISGPQIALEYKISRSFVTKIRKNIYPNIFSIKESEWIKEIF